MGFFRKKKNTEMIGTFVKYSEQTAKENYNMIDDCFEKEISKLWDIIDKKKKYINNHLIEIPLSKIYFNDRKFTDHNYERRYSGDEFIQKLYEDGESVGFFGKKVKIAVNIDFDRDGIPLVSMTPAFIKRAQEIFEEAKEEINRLEKQESQIRDEYTYFKKRFANKRKG